MIRRTHARTQTLKHRHTRVIIVRAERRPGVLNAGSVGDDTMALCGDLADIEALNVGNYKKKRLRQTFSDI